MSLGTPPIDGHYGRRRRWRRRQTDVDINGGDWAARPDPLPCPPRPDPLPCPPRPDPLPCPPRPDPLMHQFTGRFCRRSMRCAEGHEWRLRSDLVHNWVGLQSAGFDGIVSDQRQAGMMSLLVIDVTAAESGQSVVCVPRWRPASPSPLNVVD